MKIKKLRKKLSFSDEEKNLIINEPSVENQSDSEAVIQISESSEEIQANSAVLNPKRKRKPPYNKETPKLGSDSDAVNPR